MVLLTREISQGRTHGRSDLSRIFNELNCMQCPKITDLPAPPAGRTGWPWTVPEDGTRRTEHGERKWPRITVVTPSFNQGKFIEETIRSVLLQGYEDLEYIIMDGGSTDGTVAIIRKYEPWLTYWQSQPDKGQTNAINAGLSRATGNVLCYLNSDDVYEPSTFSRVGSLFADDTRDLIYGDYATIDELGDVVRKVCSPVFDVGTLMLDNYIAQPTVFMARHVWASVGPFNASLHYSMDYDFWLRAAAKGFSFQKEPSALARFRLHGESKTQSQEYGFWHDCIQLHEELRASISTPEEMRSLSSRALARFHWRAASASWCSGNLEGARSHLSQGADFYFRDPFLANLHIALQLILQDEDGMLVPIR
ncbi:MAG: glycosyltransferase, partial [Candidatus Pacebacteria bacterium]|nr:glycosyltransferase [Candidatus Paceibacterota bacterium]